MWGLPGPGLEPVSPALAGGFLTTAPPGKPRGMISWCFYLCDLEAWGLLVSFKLVNVLRWAKSQVMGQESKRQRPHHIGNDKNKSERRLRASGTWNGCEELEGVWDHISYSLTFQKRKKQSWESLSELPRLFNECWWQSWDTNFSAPSQHKDLSLLHLQENKNAVLGHVLELEIFQGTSGQEVIRNIL